MFMVIVILLIILAICLIIYAILENLKAQKVDSGKKKHQLLQGSVAVAEMEQKINRFQRRILVLENELEAHKKPQIIVNDSAELIKEQEIKFSDELKRRVEWVAKAEAELAKVKAENITLKNQFLAKENELNEEFAKNVDALRQLRELKMALESKEVACRLKEDQVQTQKHQIEGQLKSINEYLATIADFKRKEKINEWVPKVEFNELNRKYLLLEKQLSQSQHQSEED
ncbi:MAG: hypothetical protein WC543_00570 [Candidatus Omnitrophota bacterium]